MEALGVAASVVALVQALKAVSKMFNSVASLTNAPKDHYRLQNELQLVDGYLSCLTPLLEAYKDQKQFSSTIDTGLLETSVGELDRELRELERFLQQFAPKPSGSSVHRSIKALSWCHHKDQIAARCSRLQSKRMALGDALDLLHSAVGLSHSHMLLLFKEETKLGFEQLAQLIDSANSKPTEETLTREQYTSRANTTATRSSDDSSRRFLEIPTILARSCNPQCRCRCHRKVEMATPKVLTGVLGRILFSATGLPLHLDRPCSHPTCVRSANVVRISLVFPQRLVNRVLLARLAWNSATHAGLSLNLQVRRTIPWPHEGWIAVENHDLPSLHSLLSRRVVLPTDIDDLRFGQGLLLYAIRMTRKPSADPQAIWDMVDLLMRLDPDVCRQDHIGRSPIAELHFMLELPNHEPQLDEFAQRALVLAGDEFQGRDTALHDVLGGRTKLGLEEALSLAPESVDALNVAGLAPLHLAALHDGVEAIRTLLRWGASVDLVTRGEKRTALHFAARSGSLECVRALLDGGADVNYRDVYHRTALCLACLSGALDVVSLLLSRGADALAQEWDGITVARRAIEPDNHFKDAAMIRSILQQLLNHGLDLEFPDEHGRTLLMEAIKWDFAAAFEALVSLGARTDGKDHDGWTLFHYAGSFATWEMLQAMEEIETWGINPDQVAGGGHTAVSLLERRLEISRDAFEKGEDTLEKGEGIGYADEFYELISNARRRFLEPSS